MANKIQIRKDTASRWADVNPVLSQGELGLDTTVGKIKIGNGVSSWSSLSFYTGNPNTLINGSHTVTLGTDGNITLPVGGLIKNSDGTNYNNTGNLSFRNDTVYNLNGINVENSNLTHTATSSVILPANGTGDNLQLNNTYGNVNIVAGSGGQSLKSWLFGSDGRLSLPSNLTGDSVLYSDTSNIQLVSNSNTWSFKTDGTLSVPTLSIDIHNGGIQSAQVLKFSDPSKQVIITGPTPASGSSAQRIIIQGQRGTGNGEGGDVYVWGGDSDINGGDIKIYAGDADSATSGSGGYINIDAGNGYDAGGALTLSAGNSTLAGGNIDITAGYGGTSHGSVRINTANGRQWSFEATGLLSLPEVNGGKLFIQGNEIGSVNHSIALTSSQSIVINAFSQVPHTWQFSNNGNLTVPTTSSIISPETSSISTLKTAYDDQLVIVQNTLTVVSGDAGYPWGLSYPITYTAYDILVLHIADANPPPANLVQQTHQLKNSYLDWQLAIESTKLTLQAGSKTWAFGQNGTITTNTNDNFVLRTILNTTNVDYTFGTDGFLTVPNGINTLPDEDIVIATRFSTPSSPPGSPTYNTRSFTFGTNGYLTFPNGTTQTGASISITDLKTLVAASTDFSDFKTRIAAL